MKILEGKTILITGAGRGVGRAHALLCAEQGARVVVNDPGVGVDGQGQDNGPADAVVNIIRGKGGEAVADYNDISNWAGSEAAVGHAIDHFGDLDGLVNNAGIIRSVEIADASEQDFDSLMAVHVKGTLGCSRHACRYWRDKYKSGERRPRSIVNTVSDSMIFVLPDPIYGAAKAAIAHITLSASQDTANYMVRINATAPRAFTRMSMASPLMVYKPGTVAPEAEDYKQPSPSNPANSSPIVVWLLSDESNHVSGQVFRTLAGAFAKCDPWQDRELQWPANGAHCFTVEEVGAAMNRGIFGSRFKGRPLDFAPGDPRFQRS